MSMCSGAVFDRTRVRGVFVCSNVCSTCSSRQLGKRNMCSSVRWNTFEEHRNPVFECVLCSRATNIYIYIYMYIYIYIYIYAIYIYIYGEEPFDASLETSTFGSPGGGKESVYRLYFVTTVYYFARI